MAYADEATMKMMENQAVQGQNPDDARLWIKFRFHPVQNDEKSKEAGRPIYDEVEWITIMVPGDKDNVVDRQVWDLDRTRFRQQYTHWKTTGQQAETGTPIEALPFISRGQVEELKFFNVRTAEQLAALSDAICQKFMGVQSLKQKAQAFLDAASANGGARFQATLEQKEDEIKTLKQMVKDQSEKIEQLLKKSR